MNVTLGASFSIKDDILTDPKGTQRKFFPKLHTDFFIEGLPETFLFFADNSVRLCGQQIIPQWSEERMICEKEKQQTGQPLQQAFVSFSVNRCHPILSAQPTEAACGPAASLYAFLTIPGTAKSDIHYSTAEDSKGTGTSVSASAYSSMS